jgi:large subunit ribosomal protein L25
MKKHVLKASERKITGRKVHSLRLKGILPANIYGKKIKSICVEVDAKEFKKVYQEIGETGIVDISLDGKNIPILIHNVQYHPVSGIVLHADFYQVNLKEKVKTMMPVVVIGEADAVKNKVGVLLTLLTHIEVEALPTDLPEKIEVDVGKLKIVGDSLKVLDIKISENVKIITDHNLDVIKVAPLISKEAEKMAAEEAAAAAVVAASAPVEGLSQTPQTATEQAKPQQAAEQAKVSKG